MNPCKLIIPGLALAASLFAWSQGHARQLDVSPLNPPVSALLGSFTQATVPACDSSNLGKYAFITDLAGGADTVICRTPGPWARIRIGAPQDVALTSGTFTATGLGTSNYIRLTGAIPALTTLLVSVDATSMAPNSIIYVQRPGALLGNINIQLSSGGSTLPLLGSSTGVLFYNGSTLTQLQ